MKTAANVQGYTSTYMEDYRAIKEDDNRLAMDYEKAFQLIIPYLNSLCSQNPGTLAEYTTSDKAISSIFICPGMMNGNLRYVRPVVSLDAAHMKRRWGGTLFIASVLTGMDQIYPIAFSITKSNESCDTWTSFLENLSKACPVLKSQHPLSRVTYRKFTFISDRDKGLIEALDTDFPNNHSMSCAVHIQRNVQTKFGKKAAHFIPEITKTFSTREETAVFNKLRQKHKRCYEYLVEIHPSKWRSSQWIVDQTLPPRFGLTSTNMSESLNNMFKEARHATWLDAVDLIIDRMTSRISEL